MAYAKAPDAAEILKSALKTGENLGGAWLLCGVEAYLSVYYKNAIRKKLIPDPELGYFDHIRLSGNDTRAVRSLAEQIQDACAGLPVMNESKLIEVEEICFRDLSAGELSDLCTVLAALPDYPYVTVVMHCAEEEFPTDYQGRQSSTWKALAAAGVKIIPFAKQDERMLIPWCAKHFAKAGVSASQDVISAMLRRVGYGMAMLSSEMEKLSCYALAHGRAEITEGDIETVCQTTEDAQDFAIADAVRKHDTAALFREYEILKHEKAEPMAVFFQISAAIAELWRVKTAQGEGYSREDMMRRFRMKDYPLRLAIEGAGRYTQETLDRLMTRCAETDLALKSTPIDGYLLIERLICELSA